MLNDPLLESMWGVICELADEDTFLNLVKAADARFVWVARRVKEEGY